MNKQNDIKKGSPMSKGSIRAGMRNLLVVVLSIAMVTSTIPTEAYADAVKAATTAAAATSTTTTTTEATSASSTSSTTQTTTATQDDTQVDLGLALDHAYITVADQDVALPATKVSVATNKDLTFTATADEGYDLGTVTYKTADAKTDDDKVELKADENGLYTLPASAVAAGTELEVTGTQQQAVATEVTSAATPLEDDVTTSVSTSVATESLASVASESAIAVQAASGPVEITDKIADITASLTVNGKPLDSSTISRDQSIHGALSVSYNADTCPNQTSLEYTYTFPSTFIKVNDLGTQNLVDGSDIAGTYYIKDNVVHVTYDKDWVTNHAGLIKTSFSFDFRVNADKSTNKDNVSFNFPGVASPITIKFDDGKVTGNKACTVNADGTVDFTIKLSADTTVSNFVLTDTMGKNLSFVADSFKLDGNPLTMGVTTDASSGKQTATSTATTLANGDHTITYQAKISDEALAALTNGSLSDVDNTANWSWGKNGTGSANAWPNISKTAITKSNGTKNADGSIAWKVTLNSGDFKSAMAGQVFSDKLEGDQSYTGSFTVKDAAGNVVDTGTLDSTKDSFSYTFPPTATAQTYTIEYATKLANPDVIQTVKNAGTIDSGHGSNGATGTYGTVGLGTIDKAIAPGGNDATGSGRVTWTSTIHASHLGYTTFKFSDDMAADKQGQYPLGGHIWFDSDPVFTYVAADGSTQTLQEGTDYTYTKDTMVLADGNEHVWRVWAQFNDTDAMKQAIKGDILVSYSTMCDKTAGTYTNWANLWYKGGHDYPTASYTIDKSAGLTKTGWVSWNADFDNGDGTKGAWVANWTVKANQKGDSNDGIADLKGEPLDLTDTLSDGLSYVPGSAHYTLHNGSFQASGTIADTDATVASDGTLHFSVDTSAATKADGTCNAYVEVTYQTKVSKDKLSYNQTSSFSNTVAGGTGSVGMGSATGKVDVTDKVLSKWGYQNGSLVTYTISVNENAQDLDSKSNNIVLEDLLDYQTTISTSSIKVINTDGWKDITDQCTFALDTDVKDANGNPTSKLKLTVPDSTHLQVTYNVSLNGATGTSLNVSNKASLAGVANSETTANSDYQVTEASGTASGVTNTVTLTKVDADNAKTKLSGAEFELWRVDLSKWKAGSTDIADATKTKVDTEISNENGVVTFKDKSLGDNSTSMTVDVLYYYVETKAPDGYEVNSTPTYVMLNGSTSSQVDTNYDAQLALAKGHGVMPSANTSVNMSNVQKSTTASLVATKVLNDATDKTSLSTHRFDFKLQQVAEDGTAISNGYSEIAANDDLGAIKFEDIKYTEKGTYYYTISEVVPNDATTNVDGTCTKGGVTYDTTVHKVTVVVSDAEDGSYQSAVTYDGKPDAPTFKNSYSAKGSASFSATKTLTGATLESGQFSFALEQTDESGAVLSDGYKQIVKNGENGAATATDVKFSDIGYTQKDAGKTFYYTISEVVPEGAKDAGNSTWTNAGYTYDGHRVSVKVEVSDKGDGTLGITRTYDDSATAPSFSNKYVASGDVTLTASKTLTGHALANDQFEFELKDANGGVANGTVLQTKKNTDQGLVTFDAITYTTPGTYHYTISEKAGEAGKGYTYDAKVSNVTVNVSDNGSGKLEAVPSYDVNAEGVGTKTAPTFKNTYTASGSATLGAKKTLDGATLTDGQFSFTLQETDENGNALKDVSAVTAKNDADGKVSFGAINYDQDDVGTHYYTISETNLGVAGYTYSTAKYTAKVDVVDKGNGELSTSVTYTDEKNATVDVPSFVNTSATGSVTLTAKKVLEGATLNANEFTFDLKSDSADTQSIESVSNGADGSVTFKPINYTLADAGKTFTYYISERLPEGVTATSPTKDGMTYDTTVHKVDVTVAVNKDGKLDVTTKYDTTDGAAPTFTNKYATSGSVKIEATKVLTGATLTDGQFSFTLQETDEKGNVLEGGKTQTVSNVGGSVTFGDTFGDITYTKSGTYYYTISEVLPEGVNADNPTKDGVTYDTTVHTVTVTATDGGTGALDVKTTYDTTGNVAPTFTNGTTTTASLSAKKVMTNPASGETKALEGKDFKFTLEQTSAKDTANADITTDFKTQTATNDASGNVDFSAITYTTPGTYTYKISEDVPADKDKMAGVTYDTTSHTATVTVTDNAGKLTATVAYDGAAADAEVVIPTFTNTYFAASANLSATKYFYGDNQNAKFDFVLTATDDSFNARNDGVSASYKGSAAIVDDGQAFTVTVQNGAFSNKQASVTLPTITYHKKGTYYYTLAEKNTNDAVTSDTAVYQIKVEVAADGSVTTSQQLLLDGKTSDADAMEFYNNTLLSRSFSNAAKLDDVTSVSVDPSVYKSLDGRNLTAGEFEFTLEDSDGKTVANGTNDASGNVAFTASGTSFDMTQIADNTGILGFSKVGTYTYTINEVTGKDETVSYDAKTITMTVNVTTNSGGKLVANVVYADDDNDSTTAGNTFNNKVKTIDLSVRKTSKDGGEGLEGATYGLWMVNEGGNDVYMGNAMSDSTGLITFKNVALQVGSKYYFKEEAAPEGHLVDPYRSKEFTYVIGDDGKPGLSYDA